MTCLNNVYQHLYIVLYGILAQLGEHLPYKQRVTGSSPVGPIFCFLNKMKKVVDNKVPTVYNNQVG